MFSMHRDTNDSHAHDSQLMPMV